MEGTLMNENPQHQPVNSTSSMPSIRRTAIYAAVLLVVFLFGFVPMWLKSRESSTSLAQAEHHLRVARIENTLSSAAIDARRGDYEPARQAASDFFTSLRAESDAGTESAFSQRQREELQSMLAPRDEIITLLARNDSASADRLSDLYVSYREIMQR